MPEHLEKEQTSTNGIQNEANKLTKLVANFFGIMCKTFTVELISAADTAIEP